MTEKRRGRLRGSLNIFTNKKCVCQSRGATSYFSLVHTRALTKPNA